MFDAKAFWARHREKCAELALLYPCGYLKVTSVDRPDLLSVVSDPVQVSIDNASKLILAGTHKISTPEEIEVGNEHESQRKRASEAASFRDDKKMHLVLAIDQRPAQPASKAKK
jgi:hypothetical protein